MWLDAKAVKYSGLVVKLIHKAYIKQRANIFQKQWRIPELSSTSSNLKKDSVLLPAKDQHNPKATKGRT